MDKVSARSKAFASYSTRVGEWFPISLALSLVLASSAALSLFGNLWVMIAIGLLVLPTVFASTQYLAACSDGKSVDTGYILRLFLAYFRLPFLGVYRFFLNALLTLVSSFGAGLAFLTFYFLIASYADPNFAAAAEAITAAMRAGDYDTIAAAFDAQGAFGAMSNIANMVMGLSLPFFAWLYFGHYAQNAIVRNAFHFNNPRLSNYFYRFYRLVVKKEWVKERLPFLLFPLAFLAIGILVSSLCYANGMKVNFATFFGLLAFALPYAFYLPLVLYLHSHFAFAHEKSVGRAYYEGSKKLYQSFASLGRASEEELTKMRDELESMKPKDDEDESK